MQRRIARAPHRQHLAVADNGGADGEKRALRISSLVVHPIYLFISASTITCGAT
jgi:hypothetical protein